jgi:mono/diheme cytochrome c family protein
MSGTNWRMVAMTLLAAAILGIAVGGVAIVSGVYNVAADVPHAGLAFALLETIRERSVAAHARGISVPSDIDDPKRVAAGAGEYGEMCSQCHLAPGMEKTEISQGLYPAAPELAQGDPLAPSEQFWVIKHGVKFTAMPAWGLTHDDALIWNIVAFVRKLPSLTSAQYKAMTANASEEHEHMMHGDHGSSDMKMSDLGD